jgi:hypothetical protein
MGGFYEGAYGSIPGAPGAPGADGVNGYSVLHGIGAPAAGLGVNGDFYIDTAALEIYGPKTAGAWGIGTDLAGPAGAAGAAGANGTNGADATISTVEDEGTPLTARANLNFVGAGVTAADAGGKTVVTIPGAASAPDVVVQNAYQDNNSRWRRFVSSLYADNTTMRGRVTNHLAYCKTPITEGGYTGKFYYTPGGTYAHMWPVEFISGNFFAGLEFFDEDFLATMCAWIWSKQITNGSTTYTRPISGGTDTYPLGTMPSYIPASGTMSVSTYTEEIADKPLLSAPFPPIEFVYWWGVKRDFDATWLAWFDAHYSQMVDAFDSVPFNGTTGLVTQYSGTYKSKGIFVIHEFSGDHILESCLAAKAAQVLAFMCSKSTTNAGNAATWTARHDTIKAGIQAAFMEVSSPLWDYLLETFSGYPRQSALTLGSFLKTGTVTAEVLEDPNDATNNLLKLTTTGSANFESRAGLLNGATIPGPFQHTASRAKVRTKVAQTNVSMYALYLTGQVGTNVMIIEFRNDGHFKYYNGSSWVNLPTDTTYSADTWYEIEARIIWGGTRTAEIFIDGVSKGTINLLATSNAIHSQVYGGEATGEITYDYFRMYDVPTTDEVDLPAGYLPHTTTLAGLKFGPLPTVYAVYFGLLKPDQVDKAARWMKLLYDQPTASGATAGWNPLFCKVSNNNGPMRWLRWADDYHPGFYSVFPIQGTHPLGSFINGGYLHWGVLPILYTLWLASQATARELYTNAVAGITAIGADAPYEKYRVDAGHVGPEGVKYLQNTIGYYEAGCVSN